MPVKLTIEDSRDEFSGPTVAEIPDGWRIIIHRRPDGADVSVLPGIVAKPAPAAREPHDGIIAVELFTVERNRPGATEVLITDASGDRWRLFLRSDVAVELSNYLRSGAPLLSVPGSHDAALARRANAEAELIELDIAERRRAARANDSRVRADRLMVETVDGLVAIGATHLDDGRELRIDIDPVRIPWLIEKLAVAMRQAEPRER